MASDFVRSLIIFKKLCMCASGNEFCNLITSFYCHPTFFLHGTGSGWVEKLYFRDHCSHQLKKFMYVFSMRKWSTNNLQHSITIVFPLCYAVQSDLRYYPKCHNHQSETNIIFFIVFMINHRCHVRVLEHILRKWPRNKISTFRYPTVGDGPSLFVSFIWVAPLCHCVNCNCSVCHHGKFCWLVVTPGGVGLIDGGEMGSSALRGWFLIPCWALTEQIEWSTLQPIVTDCFFR